MALCRAAKEPTRELELSTSENNKKQRETPREQGYITWLPELRGRPGVLGDASAAHGERYSLLALRLSEAQESNSYFWKKKNTRKRIKHAPKHKRIKHAQENAYKSTHLLFFFLTIYACSSSLLCTIGCGQRDLERDRERDGAR